MVFAELKKGADLLVSNKVSLLMTGGVQQALCMAWEAGLGVEALAYGGAFKKVNVMLWRGILMTHVVVLMSRIWALVFCLEVVE